MAKPAGAVAIFLAVAVMAAFSFSASAQTTCAAGTALTNQAGNHGLASDCEALLSARDTLAGSGTLNWSASLSIGEWDGVFVDALSGRVTGVDLRAGGLDGQIPAELGSLEQLESLHLGENRLVGEIPAELGRLEALEGLYLNANRLEGEIPAELGGLGSLERLHLNGNQLAGMIPAALMSLSNLRVLSLSQNQLTGEMPVELGLLGSLRELYLGGNQLAGEVPAELGGLGGLERLYLDGNQLSRMIPPALGSLTNLRVLSLSNNQLNGQIPSELGELTSLQSLYLDGNRLEGTIPAALAGLANLQQLQLGGNQLTGCVPHVLLERVIDADTLGLPTCGDPATAGSVTVVIALAGSRVPMRLNTPIGITATFSQAVSGFAAEDVSVAFGTVASFSGSGSGYTFDITPIGAGPVTVAIPRGAATDADGNGNAEASQLLLGIPYDDNDDGGISRAEAIEAIRDYFVLRITRAQAIGVIGLYFASPVVIPRVADAGQDAEALEFSTVMLDGSASTGPEGSISSYQWEQVINGSRLVSLTGDDTARPGFTLPELSNDQDFVLRLTVTYDTEESAQDEVVITGRPTPRVIVGAVSGHTAVLGEVAEFGLRLGSRPSAEVVIPISSSDESEGIPGRSEVAFTPEDWPDTQIVSVRGQNANVRGGIQNYEIILGDTQSADPFYDGLEIANVAMKGISLEIMAPEGLDAFIANIPAVIQPRATYTGSYLLSYALVDAPEGMSIDFNKGTIFWTPAESHEGQTINVTVRVNDGTLFAEATFSVEVVAPREIETEIIESQVAGNRLTVTDEDTDLQGLEITSPPEQPVITTQELEELQEALGKMAPQDVPEIPSWITRVSDVFAVKGTFDNPVQLRFPLNQLPEGVPIDGVNVYVFSDDLHLEGLSWFSVGTNRSVQTTNDALEYFVELSKMQGLAFWGYHHVSPPAPFETSESDVGSGKNRQSKVRSLGVNNADQCETSTALLSLCVEPPNIDHINCEAREDSGGRNYNHITCKFELDEDVAIYLENFGEGCRWSGPTGTATCPESGRMPEDLAQWAIIAQRGLEKLGLDYRKSITIKIEPLASKGAVRLWDNYNVIYINDRLYGIDTAKWILYHEYFHHAEAKIPFGFIRTSWPLPRTWLWLIESMSEWFADELDDELNEFDLGSLRQFPRIMEEGISESVDEDNTYHRWLFIKLLDHSCVEFQSQLRNLLSYNDSVQSLLDNDFSGTTELASVVANSSCNFGSHLGPDKSSSLEAAISYYNYVTLFKQDIRLIDNNERADQEFRNPGEETSADINIPPVGAYSLNMPSITSDGQSSVKLVVEADKEVYVSITSLDDEFSGTNTIGDDMYPHTWFHTGNQVTRSIYNFPEGETSSRIFVTIVNPSLNSFANVNIYLRSVSGAAELPYPVINSHEDGEQVSNRVITISGFIPEVATEDVTRVVLRANGLETNAVLHSDGSFSEQILMFLGNNIISVQGYDGDSPVTEPAVISLEGVESSSSGRNQLVSTRISFVLRWDTDRTDVDLYSTERFGNTIWFAGKVKAPGFLDVDDVSGLGPEVISYRSPAHDVYVDGTFDVDVHYYRGGGRNELYPGRNPERDRWQQPAVVPLQVGNPADRCRRPGEFWPNRCFRGLQVQ